MPSEEFNKIIHYVGWETILFYLIQTPYGASDSSARSSLRGINLESYGWSKTNLNKLMQWIQLNIASADSDSEFKFYPTKDLPKSICDRFKMNNRSSECHLILKGSQSVDFSEDGLNYIIKCNITETYSTCFFRHIRNALAHGLFNLDEYNNIVLKDCSGKPGSSNKKYTALMRFPAKYLITLRETVLAGADSVTLPKTARNFNYRISSKKVASVLIDKEDNS